MRNKRIFFVTISALVLCSVIVLALVSCREGNTEPQINANEVTGGDNVEVSPVEEHGVYIASRVIPRALYTQHGISSTAETAETLTATVSPYDASNKTMDWSIAWKNPSSAWATGKAVTDYITVTPSSDGALTATVVCNAAFGEQAIITASVRGASDINANCTVDYRRKIVGIAVKFWATDTAGSSESLKKHGLIELSPTNLNPTVDFPFEFVSNESFVWFDEMWAATDKLHCNTDFVLSDTYTIDISPTIDDITISVALTSTYLSAIQSNGITPFETTADKYKTCFYPKGGGAKYTDFLGITAFGTPPFTNYCNLRSTLKAKSNEDMLKLKINVSVLNGGVSSVETIYNLKFSETSLSALANEVSMSKSGLIF